jgi:hypothetical protein
LLAIFTKFDALVTQEYAKLPESEDRLKEAKAKADITLEKIYIPKVMETKYPPKAYVKLECWMVNISEQSTEITFFNRYE